MRWWWLEALIALIIIGVLAGSFAFADGRFGPIGCASGDARFGRLDCGNGTSGGGGNPPVQTTVSVSLSNNTFTNSTANAVVGSLSVLMSPSTPAFSGTLTLSGANSGGFQLVGAGCSNGGACTLEANGSGTTSGTYTDVTITAMQSGAIGSPSISPTLTGMSSGGGDPTIGLLPAYNDAYANWQNAGLASVGGISTVESSYTQCGSTVTPSGLTPPTTGDDASLIKTALSACTSGHYVLLNGHFSISISEEPLQVPSGVVLRGSGTCNNPGPTFPMTTPMNTGACPTSIAVNNGMLPFTVFSGNQACGVDTSHAGSCPNGGSPIVYLAPTAGIPGWSNCGPQSGNATGLSCNGVALAADAAQGATSVQLASTSAFSVGQIVLIDEDTAPQWIADPLEPYDHSGSQNAGTNWAYTLASPEFLNGSGSPAVARLEWSAFKNSAGTIFGGDLGNTPPETAGTAGCYFDFCGRPTAELHKISAVGTSCPGTGCTLTFDDPLMIAYRTSGSHNAQVYWPSLSTDGGGSYHAVTSNMSTNSGVESISLLRGPNAGLLMRFCSYCWVENVESAAWEGGGMTVQDSLRSEFNTDLIQLCQWCSNNGGEYSFDMSEAATEILFTNSITQYGGKGMVSRAGGAGSVIAYNDFDKTHYWAGISETWVEMSANASHYIGPHHVLFEGNHAVDLDNDMTHGSSNYLTYYRNESYGYRSKFVDPATGDTVDDINNAPGGNGPFRAAGPMAYDYWISFIGNTLGVSGKTTSAAGWQYKSTCGWCTASIFSLGWVTGNGTNSNDPYLEGSTASYYYDHANYDYYNNAIEYNPGNSDHTLTNSFYTGSAPSFFSPGSGCTYTWPWVTPAGGSQVTKNSCGTSGLPAKARADAGTPFVNPSPGTVTAVALNGGTTGSYVSGASSGSSVGPVTVTMSNLSAFDGTLTTSGTAAADFGFSSSNLVTNGSTPTCTSSTPLSLNIVATPGSGETGSAFTQAVTVTCKPAGTPLTAFDPTHKSGNLTLSTVNITNDTATNTGSSTDSSVYSLNPKSETSSKMFFEYKCGIASGGIGGGISNTSGRADTYLGETNNSAAFYNTTGSGIQLYFNNTASGSWTGCVNGDTVGVTINTNVNPITVSAATYHSGSWGSFSSAYSLSSGMSGGAALYLGVNLNTNGNSSTICTNSACAVGGSGDLPSGDVWWDQAP